MGLNKLSKLGLAILEGFVGKHLGEGFVDELKSDFQSHDNLIRAMLETERIFRKVCEDKAFCQTIFDDLPITDLEPIQQAAQDFYSNPSDPILSETLKTIFVRDLKQFVPFDVEKHINSYVSLLTQQLTILDEKFSQKVNTLAALTTAEAVKETLKVMKGVAQDIHKIPAADVQLLIKRFEKISNQEQEITFSEGLRTQLALVNKTIEALTKDQFQVITWLRDKKRAAISGCAGSGKTLVAVEKAVRLANAGLSALILCHSPNLALYIENLTRNTGVQVCDFTTWIKRVIAKQTLQNYSPEWTHYEEPTDEELSVAFDLISTSKEKFDAIIVDEGQDFRETWWVIIEEALISPVHGILYIFFDDNQALLPSRARYPVEISPFSLSKNCRNSGKVFDFIKNLHSQAPEESFFLSKMGSVIFKSFDSQEDGIMSVYTALSDMLTVLDSSEIVVLTTESVPTSQSILNGIEAIRDPGWRWKEGVKNEFSQIIDYINHSYGIATHGERFSKKQIIQQLEGNLSNLFFPSISDIGFIRDVARDIFDQSWYFIHEYDIVYAPKLQWYQKDNEISLMAVSHGHNKDSLIRQKLIYFVTSWWVKILPPTPKYEILNLEETDKELNHIPLYSVSSFKGLEADGVIFFVRSLQDQIMPTLLPDLYVGASRARFYLHLVVHNEVIKYIPKRYRAYV